MKTAQPVTGSTVRRPGFASLFASGSAGVLALMIASGAQAQQAAPDAKVDEVVVTGTRIAGFVAPTPVTQVTQQELQAKADPNIAEMLVDIPQLRQNQNIGNTSQPLGASNLDLRALGPSRTLVLVDGRRLAATDPTGAIDINTLPSALIKKIEVVTGGASAAYGSDAVSGVVNIFLDNQFTGLKGNIQYGESTYGDNKEPQASLAWGTGFGGGKGHLVLSGEYYSNSGELNQSKRPWANGSWAELANPNYAPNTGQTKIVTLPNSTLSQMNDGGVIVAPVGSPLRGIQFGPGGAPTIFHYGTYAGASFMAGGDGGNFYPEANITPNIKRGVAYGHATYEFTPQISGYVDVVYSDAKAYIDSVPGFDNGTLSIRSDNAYLPASIKSIMAANGLTSFNLGRITRETGNSQYYVDTQVQRYAAGLKGDLGGDWKWDAYAQISRNSYSEQTDHNRDNTKWNNAVDAVVNPANGQIVCRSTLTNPGNGCVPANVFGAGSVSAQSVAYFTGTSTYNSDQEQDIVAGSIQGSPFSTWAGPVSTAFGLEYRKEKVTETSDPLSQAKGWLFINFQPLNGSFDVKEGFFETAIPLAKDQWWAKNLEFNGAVRLTDYSTSGTVTTWKAGLNYTPVDQIRFRGTVSHDIRAPNVNELFSGQNLSFTGLLDPLTNISRQTQQLTGGNPKLNPEESDTYTVGAVYQPSWFSCFQASVDYYNIDISDAITALTGQQIVDGCYKFGQSDLCRNVTRDPATNIITGVSATLYNAQELKTSGVDVELLYNFQPSRFVSSIPGTASLRLLGNYVDHLTTVTNGVPIDVAGQVGVVGGVPHWRVNVEGSYRAGPWAVSGLYRFVEGGKYNNTYIQGVDIDFNEVPGRSYFDLFSSYNVRPGLQVYAKMDNVFNSDPPRTLNAPAQQNYAYSVFYNTIGRFTAVGLRFNY